MITDGQLEILANYLGSFAMLLIVLYHFLEVNATDDDKPLADPKAASPLSPERKADVGRAQ